MKSGRLYMIKNNFNTKIIIEWRNLNLMFMRIVVKLIIFTLSVMLFTACDNTNAKIKTANETTSPTTETQNGLIASPAATTKNQSTASPAPAVSTNKKGFIFPNSDKQIINNDELNNIDKFTLLLAKNEIFARKGYKFKDKTLLDYYNTTDWYKPSDSAKADYNDLNYVEKKIST